MHYFNSHFFGMHPFWWIFSILFIWMLFRMFFMSSHRHYRFWKGRHRSRHYFRQRKAIDILKQRFARGEITEKEFEEKKAILENDLD